MPTPPLSALSRRGDRNAEFVRKNLKGLKIGAYDPVTSPNATIMLGIADNALMRNELVQWFNADRLKLQGRELNYGDRIFSSERLVGAVCSLFNNVPVGLSSEKPRLVKPVKPDDVVIGSGASGILDALFTVLCNPGDAVLLSVPYYNGFDHDLSSRAEVQIVPVETPLPEALNPDDDGDVTTSAPARQPSRAFAPDTVHAYEDALARARKDGKNVTCLLVCNPHNPTGLIYPRETLVALAGLAAREKLHLVMDEIYAHSVFESPDIDAATNPAFETILSIDVEKEANLPRGNVHVVTSASKDFGINGFRQGVYVNQGNEDACDAMAGLGMLSQASSPAGALWYTWLEDTEFLHWYFKENRRRMTEAYKWVTRWCRAQRVPYVAANSGHFILLDFRRFLSTHSADGGDTNGDLRAAEGQLTKALIDHGVFIAPGASYHHPEPGWFRLTTVQSPASVQEGLARAEAVLGLDSYAHTVPRLDLRRGMLPLPPSLLRVMRDQIGAAAVPGALRPTMPAAGIPDDNGLLSAISARDVQGLTDKIRDAPARAAHKLLSAISHNVLLSCLAQPQQIDDLVGFVAELVQQAQTANPVVRGIEREAKYFESELLPSEGAGEELIEHFVAELHTAILQLSTNAVTPQFEHQNRQDAPPPTVWLRALVYGAVLGRLFTATPLRAWRAVEDLIVKSLFTNGTPALATLVLLPALFSTSGSAIKGYLAKTPGKGTQYIWYDDVRSKPDELWGWKEVVAAYTRGMDPALVASVGKVVPNQATLTWDAAAQQASKGQMADRKAVEVLESFQWVFDLQQ